MASSVGVKTFAGSFERSRAKFAASATMAPRSAAARSAGTFAVSRSTIVIAAMVPASSSAFLWRSKRYNPSGAPSAIACAHASASSPAMPPPCTIVEKRSTCRSRRCFATAALTSRTRSTVNSLLLPSPAISTRCAAMRLNVCTSVSSPHLPRTSPAAISSLIMPPSARSTAPVAPPGAVTPSKRLTTTHGASAFVISPGSTVICMRGSFYIFRNVSSA